MELHRKKFSYLLILEMVKLWSVTSSGLSLTKVGETLWHTSYKKNPEIGVIHILVAWQHSNSKPFFFSPHKMQN